jgi:hypothetical protein
MFEFAPGVPAAQIFLGVKKRNQHAQSSQPDDRPPQESFHKLYDIWTRKIL